MKSPEATVADLEREVGDALTRCDHDALSRLFADDFIGINPMNIEVTKAGLLSQIGSSDYAPESIVNEVLRVRVLGDMAIVTARGVAKGIYKGQRADMEFLFTRIWINRSDVWQAVAAHASPATNRA